MRKFLDAAMERLRNFLSGLSRRDRIRLGILVALVIVLAVVTAAILGRTTYGVLYSGMDASQAGEVLAALEELAVPYKTQGSGTILVPQNRVSEVQMRLEFGGINSEAFDYSIFQQASGFNATDFDKRTYYNLQIADNVRMQILKQEKIEDCLVTLSLPPESNYVRPTSTEPAKATIQIAVKGGDALTKAEATAIAETAAGAVPGLTIENIRVLDTKFSLYTFGEDEFNSVESVSTQIQMEEQTRERLEEQVVNFLVPLFGRGNVTASVNVALNFDRETVSSVVFEPPVAGETGGIIVSMQELYESSRNNADAEGIPGTETNGLGATYYPWEGLAEDEYYNKVLREMNYEINETRSEIERAQGTIKNLSISVMINSDAVEEDYTNNVRDLVANAIGVDSSYITVQQHPFLTDTGIQDELEAQRAFMRGIQIREIIITVVKGIVILLLAISVVSLIRFIINAVVFGKGGQVVLADGPGSNVDYLADGLDDEHLLAEEIELTTKSEGIVQLEKFIDKDPQAVAQLLRNWLSDDYR